MKEKLFAKVDRAVEEGKLWKAKELLQGTIQNVGYDLEIYEKYGQVLLRMGDSVEAGKYLFLSGGIEPEYEEPIKLYLGRYAKSDWRHLLSTFPAGARYGKWAAYPESVRRCLEASGCRESNVKLPPPPPVGKATWRSAVVGFVAMFLIVGIWLIGLIAVIAFLMNQF